jgi:uncharacterized protein with ParB-like and HNH nuclease domain
MSKKISGAEYPLSKIFSSEFEYRIPSYQRPYAWTVDQASELFDDLKAFYDAEEEEGYFLGSIVLIKSEEKPLAEVIDGQQRLTTLTILLAALACAHDGANKDELKDYIVEPGKKVEKIEPKPRLSLRERDKPFFKNTFRNLPSISLLRWMNPLWKMSHKPTFCETASISKRSLLRHSPSRRSFWILSASS